MIVYLDNIELVECTIVEIENDSGIEKLELDRIIESTLRGPHIEKLSDIYPFNEDYRGKAENGGKKVRLKRTGK